MRTISINTIDEWIFDYFEGNLNPYEKEALTAFLHKNPALKMDYDTWKNSYIVEPEIAYPDIDNLLKPEIKQGSKVKLVIGIAVGCILITSLLVYMQMPSFTNVSTRSTNAEAKKETYADTVEKPKIKEPQSNGSVITKEQSVIFNKQPGNKKEAQESVIQPLYLTPYPVAETIVTFADTIVAGSLLPNTQIESNKPGKSAKDTLDGNIKKTKKKRKAIGLNNPGF